MLAQQLGMKIQEVDDYKTEKTSISRIQDRMSQFQSYYDQFIRVGVIKREEVALREVVEIP